MWSCLYSLQDLHVSFMIMLSRCNVNEADTMTDHRFAHWFKIRATLVPIASPGTLDNLDIVILVLQFVICRVDMNMMGRGLHKVMKIFSSSVPLYLYCSLWDCPGCAYHADRHERSCWSPWDTVSCRSCWVQIGFPWWLRHGILELKSFIPFAQIAVTQISFGHRYHHEFIVKFVSIIVPVTMLSRRSLLLLWSVTSPSYFSH